MTNRTTSLLIGAALVCTIGALAIPDEMPQEARTAYFADFGYPGTTVTIEAHPALLKRAADAFRTETLACEPRMPEGMSERIKRSLLPPGARMSDYELDHIVPLCLCGSNDRSNLQLQPWPEAHRKDKVEWSLCRAVRRGEMSREEAVKVIQGWRP